MKHTEQSQNVGQQNVVAAPPSVRKWAKPTWSERIRQMRVGDKLELGSEDYLVRQSRYAGAKKAFPDATFSIGRDNDGIYKITRTA